MKTLTLVPIDNLWINPEEIAAISEDSYIKGRAVITLKSNQIAQIVNISADEVIARLQKHFEPTTEEESLVVDATNVLKYAAKSFPDDVDPIRLAAGIEDVAQMLKNSKDWQKCAK
jgi:hypothetical protein